MAALSVALGRLDAVVFTGGIGENSAPIREITLNKLGLPLNPEMTAGLSIPLVLWGVWKTVQRIHARIHSQG